jgi:hypothetical protein
MPASIIGSMATSKRSASFFGSAEDPDSRLLSARPGINTSSHRFREAIGEIGARSSLALTVGR